MPLYSTTTGTKPVMSGGFNVALWNAEVVTVGSASMRIGLERNSHQPACFSIEVEFAADPGAFQIDVQAADTDVEKYYVTKASMTTGLNATFVGRVEVVSIVAKFIRLKLVSRANAVAVTAKIF